MRTPILFLSLLLPALAADATGKWTATFDTQIGEQKYTYDFKVTGTKVTGTATNQNGKSEITNGVVDENAIRFVETFDYQGTAVRIEYNGTWDGPDKINFVRKVADYAVEDLVASRVK